MTEKGTGTSTSRELFLHRLRPSIIQRGQVSWFTGANLVLCLIRRAVLTWFGGETLRAHCSTAAEQTSTNIEKVCD